MQRNLEQLVSSKASLFSGELAMQTGNKVELKLVRAFALQDWVDLKLRVKEIEIGLRQYWSICFVFFFSKCYYDQTEECERTRSPWCPSCNYFIHQSWPMFVLEILSDVEDVLVLVSFFCRIWSDSKSEQVYSSQESSQESRHVELSRSAIGRFGLSEA